MDRCDMDFTFLHERGVHQLKKLCVPGGWMCKCVTLSVLASLLSQHLLVTMQFVVCLF